MVVSPPEVPEHREDGDDQHAVERVSTHSVGDATGRSRRPRAATDHVLDGHQTSVASPMRTDSLDTGAAGSLRLAHH